MGFVGATGGEKRDHAKPGRGVGLSGEQEDAG